MILARAGGEGAFLSGDEGMPMGVVDDALFCTSEIAVEEGDCIAFYSDGVSEARNRKKEEFGAETLQKVLLENRDLSAREIVEKVVSHLNRFVGKADPHDDLTLIIAKIGPPDGK